MALDKEEHIMLVEVHTILCDTDGNKGLVSRFNEHKRDYELFKRWVMAVFFTLLGSGVLGFGIVKITDLLKVVHP